MIPELAKHPVNWLIVWLMLLIAAIGGHYVIQWFKTSALVERQEQEQ